MSLGPLGIVIEVFKDPLRKTKRQTQHGSVNDPLNSNQNSILMGAHSYAIPQVLAVSHLLASVAMRWNIVCCN
jgi:hypothetical protein